MEQVRYMLTIDRDDDGSWFAQIDELPGVFASGFTPEELEAALIEAVGMYLTTTDTYASFRPEPGVVAAAARSGLNELVLI